MHVTIIITPEYGFCNAEESSLSNQGTYKWEETSVGMNIILPCAFGPASAFASRVCSSRLVWGKPAAPFCGTEVTEGFASLNDTVSLLVSPWVLSAMIITEVYSNMKFVFSRLT